MILKSCTFLTSIAIGLSTLSLVAQNPTAKVTPTPTPKPKEGYIRFWNMLPPGGDELALVKKSSESDGETVAGARPQNYYAGYIGSKPGHYPLDLVRSNDLKTSLSTFNILLRKDVFVTFLVRMVDGKLAAEMIDDTYDATKIVSGTLVFRQCIPGAVVTATNKAGIVIPPLKDGDVHKIENLPLKPLLLQMKAKLPNGKEQNWSVEPDLSAAPRQTVLMTLDSYQRFKARVAVDGIVPAVEP